ncbi:MAG: hypothetical protein WC248_01045 [Candidatus Methanomethylophilaceae archaeon]
MSEEVCHGGSIRFAPESFSGGNDGILAVIPDESRDFLTLEYLHSAVAFFCFHDERIKPSVKSKME